MHFPKHTDSAPNHKYYLFVFILFVLGIFMGLYMSTDSSLMTQIHQWFPRLPVDGPRIFVEHHRTFSEKFLMMIGLFFRNSLRTLFDLISFPLLGMVPAISLIANGAVVGLIFGVDHQALSFGSILPHGILEISALLIGDAVSFWLTGGLLKKIIQKEKLRPYLLTSLRIYYRIILPLYLAAAIIEAFITPLVMKFLSAI